MGESVVTVISRRMFGMAALGRGRLISLIATYSPPFTGLNKPVSPLPPVPRGFTYSQWAASMASGADCVGAGHGAGADAGFGLP